VSLTGRETDPPGSGGVASAYARYGRALIRKAERMLGTADAEDIVHGLFTDLIRSPSSSIDLPYLYRAVTNRCLTHMRDQKNRARLLEARAIVSEAPCRAEEHFLDIDMATRLFGQLDDELSQLVVFRFFDNMSLEEISEVMNLSRKTVSKRLEVVREHVRLLCAEPGGATGVPS
jgi:RNA polymerase sigma-70 factor (ECF subfamily)